MPLARKRANQEEDKSEAGLEGGSVWQAGRPGGEGTSGTAFRGGGDLYVEDLLRQSKSAHSVLLPGGRLLNLNFNSDVRTRAQSEICVCPLVNFPGV